jgi:hypothetical protein
MTILITVKNHICNIAFIDVISKVFVSIVVVSTRLGATALHFLRNLRMVLLS